LLWKFLTKWAHGRIRNHSPHSKGSNQKCRIKPGLDSLTSLIENPRELPFCLAQKPLPHACRPTPWISTLEKKEKDSHKKKDQEKNWFFSIYSNGKFIKARGREEYQRCQGSQPSTYMIITASKHFVISKIPFQFTHLHLNKGINFAGLHKVTRAFSVFSQ
jgi:hypothetical protein